MGNGKRIEPVYCRQEDADTDRRRCGAACLEMVYTTLGIAVSQGEIWPRLFPAAEKKPAARSYRMAADALERGLAAVVVQLLDSQPALRSFRDETDFWILNHRPSLASPAGHYSLLLGMEGDNVLLHDPLYGPRRSIPFSEFDSLWRPHHGQSPIIGLVLIAIARTTEDPAPCVHCHATLPATTPCPGCRKKVVLAPVRFLGCPTIDCPGRAWRRFFCPNCDRPLYPSAN